MGTDKLKTESLLKNKLNEIINLKGLAPDLLTLLQDPKGYENVDAQVKLLTKAIKII